MCREFREIRKHLLLRNQGMFYKTTGKQCGARTKSLVEDFRGFDTSSVILKKFLQLENTLKRTTEVEPEENLMRKMHFS